MTENDWPKTQLRMYSYSYLNFGSHLPCRTVRKSISVLSGALQVKQVPFKLVALKKFKKH